MAGADLGGREIRVDRTNPKAARGGGGFGGRGGRGGYDDRRGGGGYDDRRGGGG